jgi:hypothetical protein
MRAHQRTNHRPKAKNFHFFKLVRFAIPLPGATTLSHELDGSTPMNMPTSSPSPSRATTKRSFPSNLMVATRQKAGAGLRSTASIRQG